ncbi:IS200/IS605 family accessory protein TnpB-related protein [Catellatospora paridis]|uniref:IS200/IS605 family accessory protein TnpB-related protein n=1 Tax=Catellatospora paridis TaxID=1617086 RepID=UPI0012D3E303|nr:IS200/IS605 family accessory protein TnpB-related protein [Catellatospora paridis]
MADLRSIAGPFVVPGPSGVAIRTRLKNLTDQDELVLRVVGAHLGSLAAGDLKQRCADGRGHDSRRWAERKRDLTGLSSSRWAGSITKASHDQWALARRGLAAHVQGLQAGIDMLAHRLSQPVGQKGTKRVPGGCRSRQEWHAKARRLACLTARHAAALAEYDGGRVRVVRGGRRLLNARHHLAEAGLTEPQWRQRWQAARWFLSADGESGKRFGNETIRVTDDGQLSMKLPAPMAHLANAPHGRYLFACRVSFAHRGQEWADRIAADRAVAYRISFDAQRVRWYLAASWQHPSVPTIGLAAALVAGCVGVDANDDHLAAWHLDTHGNPVGAPRRFFYDLSGSANHRDAQVRHALSRLLHWAKTCGVKAIAIEDLDFAAEKTREKHGRRKRFRRLISRFPTGRLRARLTSMADQTGITIVAVDPAYTSKWGAEHWHKPMDSPTKKITRHDAASIVIARRAQGHKARRRTSPPPPDQRDRVGHRSLQAGPDVPGCEGPRRRIPGPRTRCASPDCDPNAGDQCAQHRSGHTTAHAQLMHSS